MSRYPVVLFFRYEKYNDADNKVKNLNCDVKITSDPTEIEKLYSTDVHILITYGPHEHEYHKDVNKYICQRLRKRWIHHTNIEPKQFERGVNYCFIDTVIKDRKESRPVFSAFTTCFNSFEKILRPYNSLIAQTELDWEWVIVDDSTDEANWESLKLKFINMPKIRLYKKAKNSGNIGNVKNEAIGLCRGKFVLELDHDDEILPDLFKDAVNGFTKFPDVDFIYMDFINIYEDKRNFSYGDFICKGYGGYYYQYYPPFNSWTKVYVTPQINNITASYLFCMPNHPRIWRREKLLEIGSYSEFLPICDDQEILLRTILNLNILKIPKSAYIQYFNDGGSNFSLLRNKEINRIGPNFLTPQFKAKFPLDLNLQNKDAWTDNKYDKAPQQLWMRNEYKPNYINKIYNPDYDTQFGIIGVDVFNAKLETIKELYKNPRNDFFLIDNSVDPTLIFKLLTENNLTKIKFYVLKNTSKQQLQNYFERIYKSTEAYIIMK
jgi:glycosyltransferase involved in cell wall biosynthesis